MIGLTFTCRRCGVHGGALVIDEITRANSIKPSNDHRGFATFDRDTGGETESRRYFECALCHAAEVELDDLFVSTTGAAG